MFHTLGGYEGDAIISQNRCRVKIEFWAFWGWIFGPLCGKIVIDTFVYQGDDSPGVERRPTC